MEFKKKDRYDINDLLKIVEMLRDKENGCDWDKIQTHESIRQNFIEEAYEAVDAIDQDDKELMLEELGDVLLQVLMHARFEEEEGSFDFEDVVSALAAKLVLRHPHIFKGEQVSGARRVLNRWEEIKNESHGYTTVSRTLNAVPKSFPALMYAQKVQKRVQAGKLPVPGIEEEADRITSLAEKIKSGDRSEENFRALLFSAVNAARQRGFDSEGILRRHNKDFVKKFNKFEDLALQMGIGFDIITPVTVSELWIQAESTENNKNQ